jgi:hypothetical protein
MTALAALLERPLWELALGATSLVAACVIGALIFFWIGFRIAEVAALVGFEEMFGRQDLAAAGNATAISTEVAARLRAVEDRRRSLQEKSSLDELALATRALKLPPPARGYAQPSKSGERERQP